MLGSGLLWRLGRMLGLVKCIVLCRGWLVIMMLVRSIIKSEGLWRLWVSAFCLITYLMRNKNTKDYLLF